MARQAGRHILVDDNDVPVYSRVNGSPVLVSSSGSTNLFTPPSGKSIRLRWFGMATPEANTATTIVEVWLGTTRIYMWPMGAPGIFAHTSIREGAKDDSLYVVSSQAQAVYCNFDYEVFE